MIELAIALPVFFAIVMGTIETCHVLYLKQSLKLAAYEAARVGIMPGMNSEVMLNQCNVILKGRRIADHKFSCNPPDPTQLAYGDYLTTTVSAPLDQNALAGSWFFKQQFLTESVTIMAEH